jgi:hypothetical protein
MPNGRDTTTKAAVVCSKRRYTRRFSMMIYSRTYCCCCWCAKIGTWRVYCSPCVSGEMDCWRLPSITLNFKHTRQTRPFDPYDVTIGTLSHIRQNKIALRITQTSNFKHGSEATGSYPLLRYTVYKICCSLDQFYFPIHIT